MADYDDIRIPWHGWKIVRKIGSGTFGTVYEIERRLLDTTEKAAMKVIPIPRDESDFEMMLLASGYDEDAVGQSIKSELLRVEREYAMMSKLRGISNIVSCDDFAYTEREGGRGYTVFIRMELLKSIQSVIKDRRRDGVAFTEAEAIRLGKDICRALMVCDKHDIIHRDIKPQNILISELGDYNLGDFGTARSLDHSTHATYAGTVSFMAPEVFRREKYGKTVDIYSLGLMMYWLMNGYRMPFVSAGKVPTSDELTVAENRRMSGEPLPAPCNAGPELAGVILRACAYRSEDRYRSAEEMMDDLIRLERGEAPAAISPDEQPVYRVYPGEGSAGTALDDEATVPMFGFGGGDEETEMLPETDIETQSDLPKADIEAQDNLPETDIEAQDEEPQLEDITDPEEQYQLGREYYYGFSLEQDYDKAVSWYRKAAKQGHPEAQNNLGLCYEYGQGVERDYIKAATWYLKSAGQGNEVAQYNIGLCYQKGLGVEQNHYEAASWYRKSAEHGYADAQFLLGVCYEKGLGVEQDYYEAAAWYRKAAKQGDADAQYHLGTCYKHALGVDQDYTRAAAWYIKAAEQGNADAQNDLGVLYEKGLGVDQGYHQAVEWYLKAAEQGNADAQSNLGYCYYRGRGVLRDYNKAVEWYLKAAEQGNANAQNNLGVCYVNGLGVEIDLSKAAYWYLKAAKQGLAVAQNNIGYCYEEGRGIEQNLRKAAMWYRRAANKGNEKARKNLKRVRPLLD